MTKQDEPSSGQGPGMGTRRPSPTTEPDDREIEELLRSAGPRPAPPEEARATVKAAAIEQWRRTVREERRRRAIRRTAAGLLAAAALLVAILHPAVRGLFGAGGPATVATAEASSGAVKVSGDRLGSATAPLRSGDPLNAGSVLETSARPQPARLLLRLAGGGTVRADAGTRLTLVSASRLQLHHGAIYVDSGDGAADLAVETRLGEVREIGTRFEVRLAAGEELLRVRVRSGEVVLEHAGATHRAGVGSELVQEAGGELTRGAFDPHDSDWDWTLAVLPAFDVEGRTLHEFLAWAASQGGRPLRFAEPGLEAESRQVVLHGSISGLSLVEALSALLAGSGLEAHLEPGVLRVEAESAVPATGP